MQNNVVENMKFETSLIELKPGELIDKKKVYLNLKRTSDVVISSLALVALSPILLTVAGMIKLDSKGPAIIKQERIGQNGKVFKMYKYRSMVEGADEMLDDYLKANKEAAEEYKKYKKIKNDPRITKVGAFIRKTSIDELPQLINVVIGDMSLVGPRPYLVREKDDMKEHYNSIIKSKPGITGPWQVSGRNDVTFEERLNIESTYNENQGIKNDTKLLMKTITKVIKQDGAI